MTTKNKVGRPATITQADKDRIIELYNEGYSYRGIQQFVKVNLRTISAVINTNPDKLTREQYKGGRPSNH